MVVILPNIEAVEFVKRMVLKSRSGPYLGNIDYWLKMKGLVRHTRETKEIVNHLCKEGYRVEDDCLVKKNYR